MYRSLHGEFHILTLGPLHPLEGLMHLFKLSYLVRIKLMEVWCQSSRRSGLIQYFGLGVSLILELDASSIERFVMEIVYLREVSIHNNSRLNSLQIRILLSLCWQLNLTLIYFNIDKWFLNLWCLNYLWLFEWDFILLFLHKVIYFLHIVFFYLC